jgi:hypothetical protein
MKNESTRKTAPPFVGLVVLIASMAFGSAALPQPDPSPPRVTAQQTGCTHAQRREALGRLQTEVLQVAPRQVESLEMAVQPDGPLPGWQLSHGHVVLAEAGAVGVPPISLANANAPGGGLQLPEGSFFYLVNGRKRRAGAGSG